MKSGQLRNLRTGELVGRQVWKADSFWTRLRGLLGRPALQQGEGLWLFPCKQVHMWGMNYPISAWFIDRTGKVCEVDDNLRPGKISSHVSQAAAVIEFSQGWAEITGTCPGDILAWEEI